MKSGCHYGGGHTETDSKENPPAGETERYRERGSAVIFQSSAPESIVAFACTQFIHSIRHSKQHFSNLLHTEPWISYVHSSPYKRASPLASNSALTHRTLAPYAGGCRVVFACAWNLFSGSFICSGKWICTTFVCVSVLPSSLWTVESDMMTCHGNASWLTLSCAKLSFEKI